MFFFSIFLEPENEKNGTNEEPVIRRGRRRAAAQAIGSLKEIPSNKKLRQGDPVLNNMFQYSTSINKGHRMSSTRETNVPKSKVSAKTGKRQ